MSVGKAYGIDVYGNVDAVQPVNEFSFKQGPLQIAQSTSEFF